MVSWETKEKSIRALERNGVVRPQDLIEAARDASHPCHGDFTWDVEKAAQERWWDQARALIRQCSFEVQVEEVGERVVNYVSNGDSDDPVFVSVPKLRGKGKVVAMMLAEISMLHGIVSRVYGLALSKEGILGSGVSVRLKAIKTELRGMKDDLSDE